jgi:hypothetical protein
VFVRFGAHELPLGGALAHAMRIEVGEHAGRIEDQEHQP